MIRLRLPTVVYKQIPCRILTLANFLFTLLAVYLFYCFLQRHRQTGSGISVEREIPDLTVHKKPAALTGANHRIRYLWEGLCVDNTEGTALTGEFCNPLRKQLFQLQPDGKLLFLASSLCVAPRRYSSEMMLTACEGAPQFSLIDKYLVLKTSLEGGPPLCVAPSLPSGEPLTRDTVVGRGAPLALLTCHTHLSSMEVLNEEEFVRDRAALLLPPLPTCPFPACGINRAPLPVQQVPSSESCTHLAHCVTVVVKSARRPLLVLNLATSIRHTIGYDLPIVVWDDGVGNYSQQVWDEIGKFPKIRYYMDAESDVGIGAGRNKAAGKVLTKYLLLTDDDSIFTPETDLRAMVKLLDQTDASLVGGYSNPLEFAGDLEFGYLDGRAVLLHYHGVCSYAHRQVAGFPACYNCQITDNFFLARTLHVQQVGGWSPELKVKEHKDFFVRMKAAQNKVVFCPKLYIKNDHKRSKNYNFELDEKYYLNLRYDTSRLDRMWRLFNNRWNIDSTVDVGLNYVTLIAAIVGILLVAGIGSYLLRIKLKY